ncbi:TPA: hypothetical protein DEG21_04120 [Patescibacteria group bacterium]|nr:hypothetical protein [Candidatus Gracilibacteria bacterium]
MLKCLALFSTTTIESSTSIQRDKIRAKSVILLISSPKINHTINTIQRTIGIQKAAFSAFLNPRKIISITRTTKILTKR